MTPEGKRRQELLRLAVTAVQKAGAIITGGDPGNVTDKGDRDMSTDMDLASEQAVRKLLGECTPDIPMLGEEEGGPDPSTGTCWVLDPIDGTVNYIHGLPTFAVALSLIEAGRTTIGVIHVPTLGATYTGSAGSGSHVNGTPLKVSTTTSLSQSLVVIDQFTFVDDDPEQVNALRLRLIDRLTPVTRRMRINGSSAIDLAWTAEGRFDACVMLANNPWDTSAGTLIAREAGAAVTDLHGAPHELGSATTVAAAPGVADELVEVLRSGAETE